MTSVAVVTMAALAFMTLPIRAVAAIAVVIVGTFIHPLVGVSTAGCLIALLQLHRIRRTRSSARDTSADSILAVELVGLGVTSGLSFRNAARMTADQIGGVVGTEIMFGLRTVAAGQFPTLESPSLRSIFAAAELSERTGVPLAVELNAIALDRRRDEAAATRERLAKLPVKMLFPLAFLILPGFVLLTVVPPLVSGLSRISL